MWDRSEQEGLSEANWAASDSYDMFSRRVVSSNGFAGSDKNDGYCWRK